MLSNLLRKFRRADWKVTFLRDKSTSSIKLSYDVYGHASPSKSPLLILHGLLGSKTNWKSLAKAIASSMGREVYAVDARNHGDSPHAEEFNYHVMAEDFLQFAKDKDFRSICLLGHSMGGRSAMLMALTQPQLIEKLVVVDVSPVSMPSSSTTIAGYLEVMRDVITAVPPGLSIAMARKFADKYMEKFIPEGGIRQFLLTNLAEKKSSFGWKANVDVIAKSFTSSIMSFPPVQTTYDKETLFICGGKSSYVSHEDHEKIRQLFTKAKFAYIPGAGHWVHADKPTEFLEKVKEFL